MLHYCYIPEQPLIYYTLKSFKLTGGWTTPTTSMVLVASFVRQKKNRTIKESENSFSPFLLYFPSR